MTHKNDDENKKRLKPTQTDSEDDIGEGLTDDERVSRESEPKGEGKVTLGPADLERLPKSQQEGK
jgi:hypothetical protein